MTVPFVAREPFHVLTKPIGPLCNLACEHCFYLNKTSLFPDHERFRMRDDVLELFTRQYIEGQPENVAEINFAWQGGEPSLMGLDFFRRAVELQKKYAHLRPRSRIVNAFQTNGTLLDTEWAAFFHQHHFLLGISLDGPTALHDHYRKDTNGKGSLARAMQGLEALKQEQVEFNTLTCIQRHNADHPARIYDFLRDSGSTFMQFIPIVVKDSQKDAGVSESTVRPRQFGRFLIGIFNRWLERGDIGRIYVQLFEVMLGVVAGYPPSLCVHSKFCGRSVALEHNGDLFSCDHFVFPQNCLGNIREHSLAEMLDGAAQTRFGRNKFDRLPPTCLACPFLRFCHGACPANRIGRAPAGKDAPSYLCAGYKMFFSHSLPYFQAMAECLKRRLPAMEYRQFMGQSKQTAPATAGTAAATPGRNAPCPCGSGKKYKHCCAKKA